jgi:predicted DCC family thiol-disulfide oxidoreductase YuxK
MTQDDASEPAHGVILFDGVCNLCNASVNFVIDRDPASYFRFAALQSDSGRALLRRHGLDDGRVTGVVLISDSRAYTGSAAAVRIARHLRGAWKLLAALIIVPPFLRDAAYGLVARRRYRWFGKTDTCRVPTPELRERFL